MRTHAFTHREWTSNPAQRGYMTCIRYLLYREALAWSPPVRNLEDALTGRSGVAIRGARGTPGQTTLRALSHQSRTDLCASVTRYTVPSFIHARVRHRRVENYAERLSTRQERTVGTVAAILTPCVRLATTSPAGNGVGGAVREGGGCES